MQPVFDCADFFGYYPNWFAVREQGGKSLPPGLGVFFGGESELGIAFIEQNGCAFLDQSRL